MLLNYLLPAAPNCSFLLQVQLSTLECVSVSKIVFFLLESQDLTMCIRLLFTSANPPASAFKCSDYKTEPLCCLLFYLCFSSEFLMVILKFNFLCSAFPNLLYLPYNTELWFHFVNGNFKKCYVTYDMCLHVHAWACLCWSQRKMLGAVSYSFLHIPLWQGLPLNLKLTCSARLATQEALGICWSPLWVSGTGY